MSLCKRSGSTLWWCDYTKPNGERVRESARTSNRREAEEFEAKRKNEAWRVHQLGERPRRLWEDAVVKHLGLKAQSKSLSTLKGHLRWLHPHLHGKYLDEIDSDVIETIRQAKAVCNPDAIGIDAIANPATVNRTMEVVLSILRAARDDWVWIDRIPKVPMYEEPKGRVRWLTLEQVQRLMMELPEHQKAMALFDLSIGVRQANVRLLEWTWVDLERGSITFPANAMKSGEHHTVTLNEGARYVLTMQQGMHPKYVFPYRGKPVKKLSTRAWREALARANITDFRWHDLRHTWASWLRQRQVPLDVIKELGGWRTLAMVERYAHIEVSHLAEYSDRLPNVAKQLMDKPQDVANQSGVVTPTPTSANVIHVTFTAQWVEKARAQLSLCP